jgi:hypothetical protein
MDVGLDVTRVVSDLHPSVSRPCERRGDIGVIHCIM